MKNPISSTIIGLFAVIFAFLPSATKAAQTITTRDCGPYHYDIRRITDGFFVTVTDSGHVRTILYRDVIGPSSVFGSKSNVITGCADASLAFVDALNYKYGKSDVVKAIDPTGTYLRLVTIGWQSTSWIGDLSNRIKISPASSASLITELLSRPTENWIVERTELVGKTPTAIESANMLNDRSFYVFDGKGGYIKKTANSSWNTTQAIDTALCSNGTTYVLYQKMFAETNTPTSTFPNVQYIVERSGNGPRTLIPVPYVDGSWQAEMLGASIFSQNKPIYFGSCMGASASLNVHWRVMTANPIEFKYTTRVAMITPTTTVIDYINPSRSIEAGYKAANSIISQGALHYYPSSGITGSSIISELHADGTVTQRKPIYFRDITSYGDGVSFYFRLDPIEPSRITLAVKTWSGPNESYKYYMETNGVYQEVDRSENSWATSEVFAEQGTHLYLSADKDMITVRSFYLAKPMLLHYLPNTAYTLNWYRIGPLELDGTRKVWYELTVHGKKEMWFARVR